MRGLRSVWSSYHNLNPVVVLVQVSYSHLLSVIRATLVSAGGPDNFIFFDTLLIHINISGRVDLTEKETGLSGLQYVCVVALSLYHWLYPVHSSSGRRIVTRIQVYRYMYAVVCLVFGYR